MKIESLKQTIEDVENLYGNTMHVYVATDDEETILNPNDDVVSDFTSEVVWTKPMPPKKSSMRYDHKHDEESHDDGDIPTLLLIPKHEGDDITNAVKKLNMIVNALDSAGYIGDNARIPEVSTREGAVIEDILHIVNNDSF